MKIDVSIEFFDSFPPDKVEQFMLCVKDVQDGRQKHGKIELSVQDGKIVKITQMKHFEK